jgi:hypothetical protein
MSAIKEAYKEAESEGDYEAVDILDGENGIEGMEYNDGKLLVALYSDRTSKTSKEQTRRMNERAKLLLKHKGAGIRRFREKAEHLGLDMQCANITIPIQTEEQMRSIVRQVKGWHYGGKTPASFQLEEMFKGKLDEKTLENLVKDVDAEMSIVTLRSGSTGVVSFYFGGLKSYGKVSTSLNALRNEYKALIALQEDKLAKLLVPRPIGIAESEHAGALFTYGTENKSLYDEAAMQEYFALFNTLIFQYSRMEGRNLNMLLKDKTMQRVFNLAIINTALKAYTSLNARPEKIPVEQLNERAGANDFRRYEQKYLEAYRKAENLEPGSRVFIPGDSRPENTGKDPYGIMPLVDLADAKMGYVHEELASLEIRNPEEYVDWYKLVMTARGADFRENATKELTVCHNIMQPYRTGTFKFGKGRLSEAEQDLERLAKTA